MEHVPQGFDQRRFQPRYARTVELRHRHPAEEIDDEAGQAVGLGMDDPAPGRDLEPFPESERRLQPRRQPARVDVPFRVLVEPAHRRKGARIEHRRAERLAAALSSRTSVPGSSARSAADMAISLA